MMQYNTHLCNYLSWYSIAGKRRHDHGNTYKDTIFNWGGLHFQSFVHYHDATRCCAGRYGAGAVVKYSTSSSQQEVN